LLSQFLGKTSSTAQCSGLIGRSSTKYSAQLTVMAFILMRLTVNYLVDKRGIRDLAHHFKTEPTETVAFCFGVPYLRANCVNWLDEEGKSSCRVAGGLAEWAEWADRSSLRRRSSCAGRRRFFLLHGQLIGSFNI
jgi:hypothetical protein